MLDFFLSSISPFYGFRLCFPKLRIILSALSITCGFLLYCVENNNLQDHCLSFLMQFWAWLQDRPLDTKVPSYCLMSFLSNPTFSGFTNFEISFFRYWLNFFLVAFYCVPDAVQGVLNIVCCSAQCRACAHLCLTINCCNDFHHYQLKQMPNRKKKRSSFFSQTHWEQLKAMFSPCGNLQIQISTH